MFIPKTFEVLMLNHAGTQTLETERLLLRKYRITDAEDMFNNWVTDSKVSRFWEWDPYKDIHETKSLLLKWIAEYSCPERYRWVVVNKGISQAAGYIYLNEINDEDNNASIHYLLS